MRLLCSGWSPCARVRHVSARVSCRVHATADILAPVVETVLDDAVVDVPENALKRRGVLADDDVPRSRRRTAKE